MEQRNFDLTSFKKISQEMVVTNDNTYIGICDWNNYRNIFTSNRLYKPQEIASIIQSGSLLEKQKLSRYFFNRNGYYRQIIMHYATLFTYRGILIPNVGNGKNIKSGHISKRYYSALDYIEASDLPSFYAHATLEALINGCYYGVIVKLDNKHLNVIDLPITYCRSQFKDLDGNDLIEFDLRYFESILDEATRQKTLKSYPDEIIEKYKKWKRKNNETNPWIIISASIGVCFQLFDGIPLFLSIIPKILDYDQAIDQQMDKEADQIKKIVVQKVPHLADGRLVFEPDEALQMHNGAVGMLKGNKNINVLTTYADVDCISSKTSLDNANTTLERVEKNIYSEAGVSNELFASSGSSSLEMSTENDMSLMIMFVNKISRFITNIINSIFANSNISFKYQVLPVTHYNMTKYVDTSFKLSQSGYSFLLPAIALGISQRDLINVKQLENNLLQLGDKLIPLQSSYTQSSSDSGRPEKEQTSKTQTTIETQQSRQNN